MLITEVTKPKATEFEALVPGQKLSKTPAPPILLSETEIKKFVDLAVRGVFAQRARPLIKLQKKLVAKLKKQTPEKAKILTKQLAQISQELVGIGQTTELWQEISSRCSNAIQAMQTSRQLLYRGTEGPRVFRGMSRNNRRASDTAQSVQRVVDEFLGNAGFQALRGNSIFATSNRSQADSYGTLYLIFPVDGAAITWNKKYIDFYSDVADGWTAQDATNWIRSGISASGFNIQAKKILNLLYKLGQWFDSREQEIFQLLKKTKRQEQQDSLNLIKRSFRRSADQTESLLWDFERSNPPPNLIPHSIQIFNKIYKNTLKDFQSLVQIAKLLGIYDQLASKLTQYLKEFNKMAAELQGKLQATQQIATSPDPAAQKKLAEQMGFVSGNLAGALRSGNEIYISGEYYALELNLREGFNFEVFDYTSTIMSLLRTPGKK